MEEFRIAGKKHEETLRKYLGKKDGPVWHDLLKKTPFRLLITRSTPA